VALYPATSESEKISFNQLNRERSISKISMMSK
jgi:non-homologous end joining protein Ku